MKRVEYRDLRTFCDSKPFAISIRAVILAEPRAAARFRLRKRTIYVEEKGVGAIAHAHAGDTSRDAQAETAWIHWWAISRIG